jgi:hypothetical protein
MRTPAAALQQGLGRCSIAGRGSTRSGRARSVEWRLTPARRQDQDEPNDGEDRAAKHPRPLVDHEARCGPMDIARALPDPQQAHEQCEDAEDEERSFHRGVTLDPLSDVRNGKRTLNRGGIPQTL